MNDARADVDGIDGAGVPEPVLSLLFSKSTTNTATTINRTTMIATVAPLDGRPRRHRGPAPIPPVYVRSRRRPSRRRSRVISRSGRWPGSRS
jgi:hypothetical protein